MKREPVSKSLRFEVFKRDGFTCQYCGARAPKAVLHADHITAVARGGRSRTSNLVTACEDCNLGKGAHECVSARVGLVARAQSVCDEVAARFGKNAGRQAFPLVLRVLEYAQEENFCLPSGEHLIDYTQRFYEQELRRGRFDLEEFMLTMREQILGAEDLDAREAFPNG